VIKQKDIMLIAVLVIVSGVVSLLVSRFFFAKPADRQQQVEIVDVITSDFPTPPVKYFNNSSIDPTQSVQIGDNANANPFQTKKQ
jgi:hypothetical protein